jgi:citrate lyase beta subunit
MKKIPIIQYLPLTRPKASRRLLKTFEIQNIGAILDLEDSAQNIFDYDETRILKNEARSGLLSIASTFNSTYRAPLYIRINSMDTEFFEKDIECILKVCKQGIPITGIFLPMVRDYSQILKVNQLLSSSSRAIEIVPMVETKMGVNNLSMILNQDKENNHISKVHYGHFDYCLDAKLWPFPDPNQKSYWEIIKPIIKLLNSHNKIYIHTPFPFPQDAELFWQTEKYLSSFHSLLDSWACTVNSGLSLMPQPKKIGDLKVVDIQLSATDKMNEANKIYNHFLSGQSHKRSFSVKENRFIAPHQYLMAKEYLENNKV